MGEREVACVGRYLVDVSALSRAVVLELVHHNGPTDQYDHIGAAATLPRKFVLESSYSKMM